MSGTPYDEASKTSHQVDESTVLLSKTDAGEATDSLPAMYIYNLSRSQWANRINLEWIYLDVAERSEEQFQVLVNTVPEEPTPGYADEMKVASEALSKLIDIRNEKPLKTTEHSENPKGKMVLFRQGEDLEKILNEHTGEKRLLFAGGSKKFYRNLSRLNHDLEFCTEETKRFEKVSNSIGESGEDYIRNFLGIGNDIETRIKRREEEWKRMRFQLENFRIQRKIYCSIKLGKLYRLSKESSLNYVRNLTRRLQTTLQEMFEHTVHDLRITATVFIPDDSDLEPENFDGAALKIDVFRSLSKCINKISLKKRGKENEVELKDFSERKLRNTETLVLSPISNQRISNKEFVLYDYQFDTRNTQRSIFQILTLLYFGKVRVKFPHEYMKNFQNWFDVCSVVGNHEIKQVLNNMKGKEIRKCWEENRLATGVLCSELFEELTGEEAVQALTLAHTFFQTSSDTRLPLTLQKWPNLTIKQVKKQVMKIKGRQIPKSKQLEDVLTSSLFQLMNTNKLIFTTDPEKVSEQTKREKENLPSRSKSLPNHAVTPDATCLRRGKKGEASTFYIIDITTGGGKTTKAQTRWKLKKYQPTDLGKSFITKTIIVTLSSSDAPAVEQRRMLGLYEGHEKVLILNMSKMTKGKRETISSETLSELLKQLMSKDVWGIQYMIHDGSTQLLSYD